MMYFGWRHPTYLYYLHIGAPYIPPGEIVKGYAWEIIEIHPKSLRGCRGEMAKTPFTLMRGMSEEIINCPHPYLRNY